MEEVKQEARVRCFLVDIEGKKHRVPRAWRGADRDEVLHKMLHVQHWVPYIVAKVIEVEEKS